MKKYSLLALRETPGSILRTYYSLEKPSGFYEELNRFSNEIVCFTLNRCSHWAQISTQDELYIKILVLENFQVFFKCMRLIRSASNSEPSKSLENEIFLKCVNHILINKTWSYIRGRFRFSILNLLQVIRLFIIWRLSSKIMKSDIFWDSNIFSIESSRLRKNVLKQLWICCILWTQYFSIEFTQGSRQDWTRLGTEYSSKAKLNFQKFNISYQRIFNTQSKNVILRALILVNLSVLPGCMSKIWWILRSFFR